MLSLPLEIHNGEEVERNRAQTADVTTTNSSPSGPSGPSQPAATQKMSHLPTPQSPSNLAQYASDMSGPFSSPVSNMTREAPTPHVSGLRATTPTREDVQTISVSSFITPESSPLFPRKVMPPVTPDLGSSSSPHTPQRNQPASSEPGTPQMPAEDHSSSRIVVDTGVPALAPAPIITTPVSAHSRGITPASRLSSPFQDRTSDRRATKSKSRSPMPPAVDDSAMVVDVFSIARPSTPPPLITPVPQRVLSSDIHRIHLQAAADHAERLSEKEARRPDYLVRGKRPHPDDEIPSLDELDAASAVLGVTESPIKGRRLQLFQATSEETFEQSLLAGGYPAYGSPAYNVPEPQTPLANSRGARSTLSQRALQWLQQATPGQPGPSAMARAEEPPADEEQSVPSEKEVRKRRRLELFKEHSERKDSGSRLYPVELEGCGRVLVNVPPEGAPAHPETPPRKRPAKKRKRRGGRKSRGGAGDDDGEPVEPDWPDQAFPWCMRAQERSELAKMEEEERLKWIERFLDRDSESDEEDGDQVLRPPLQSHDNDQIAHRRGRGKMVPVRVHPTSESRSENKLVPSDPADARAALLSKRSVRALAARRHREDENDGEEVLCVGCNRGDDGSELVQCDECQTWYHLRCIGIKKISDLGKEEDPWYCDACLDIRPSSPLTEPTFVPTDDRPIEPSSRRDSLFLQNSILESPAPHWEGIPRAPTTPVRDNGIDNADRTFSTRSSWGDSSRAGPSTPDSSAKTVRVYHTPGPFVHERDQLDPETPFDPTTTPSRGIKFSGGPPPTLGLTTPRGSFGIWAGRGGQTPTPVMKPHAAGHGGAGSQAWRHGVDDSGGPFSSPYSRHIYNSGYDDTPITRTGGDGLGSTTVQGRRLWDSPGFARPVTPSPKVERVDEKMDTEA
ncbi:hypothetical protein PYCCODRAFT_1432173 [Trametes coccinea BRFM310]|uniref:PHD-type domain-containing protein n=1 Tax=Trametes coccinea (strain BRFM310) TaxID=1353009 RepID=A0A1Y2IYA4_TRAC3|nr:hypothetical protein PYCCODRAFT_1432173 [Trametes coccinea BRFM310]